MAQMVKAIRMILGIESFGPVANPQSKVLDIEIEDDTPKRKPSLEELDALEVLNFLSRSYAVFCLQDGCDKKAFSS